MKSKIKVLIALLLSVLGLSLIFISDIQNFLVERSNKELQVSNYDFKELKVNSEKEASYDFSQVRVISASEVIRSQVVGLDLEPIGGISIPELELNLPILKGTTNTNLLYGAATMKEQVMGEGNYSLASHNVFSGSGAEDMLFSPIVRAKEGMTIYITDKEYVYSYRIESVFVVDPTAVHVIEDSEGDKIITLVTCTDPQALQRTIVRGKLVDKVLWNDSSLDVISSFSS